jgi:hypothetical protein
VIVHDTKQSVEKKVDETCASKLILLPLSSSAEYTLQLDGELRTFACADQEEDQFYLLEGSPYTVSFYRRPQIDTKPKFSTHAKKIVATRILYPSNELLGNLRTFSSPNL